MASTVKSIVWSSTRAELRAIVGLTPPKPTDTGNGRKRKMTPAFERELRKAAWGELELRKRQPGIRGGI